MWFKKRIFLSACIAVHMIYANVPSCLILGVAGLDISGLCFNLLAHGEELVELM